MLIMDCLKWTEKQHEIARQRIYGCLDAVCVNFITSEICNYLAYINSQAGVMYPKVVHTDGQILLPVQCSINIYSFDKDIPVMLN